MTISSQALPAAVLWDMDGTLIDSEPYWIGAEIDLCKAHGVEWTYEDGVGLIGSAMEHSTKVLQDRGVTASADEIAQFLTNRVRDGVHQEVPWQADGKAFLERVVALGVPCVLVTMSYRVLAEAFANNVPGVFTHIVCGDEVGHGKPHPEPYLRAAEALGVDITDCVAVEDSPSGIRSAHASGAKTIAIKRLTPLPPFPGMTRVRSLDSITDDALLRVTAGEVIDELGDEE